MPSAPLGRTSGRSDVLTRWAALPASTQGCGGGLYRAIKASARGECNEDSWVSSGGKVLLYRWFSAGVVSASSSSKGSILLGWLKSNVVQTIASIYSSENLCIYSSSRMRPSISVVLAKLVKKFGQLNIFWVSITFSRTGHQRDVPVRAGG